MSTDLETRPLSPAPPRPTWVWPIRILTAGLSVVLLAAGAASVVSSFLVHTRTSTRTFTVGVRQVEITSNAGDVTVRTGKTAATTVTNRLSSSFRKAEHSETLIDGVLHASGGCRGEYAIADSCSSDLTLTVPPGTTVTVHNANGDTSVNATNAITVTSTNGDVRLVGGGGGAIRATTKNGDVHGLRLAAGTVYARSSNGDVSLTFSRAPGHVTALSKVGDVQVVVPDDGTSYRVTSKAGVGDRTIEVPTSPAGGRTITASSSVGDLELRTGK